MIRRIPSVLYSETLRDIYTLESEVCPLYARYKWDWEIVFTIGGVHISEVLAMGSFAVAR